MNVRNVYRSDIDPNIHYMAVVFESKEAYFANAERPETSACYRLWPLCIGKHLPRSSLASEVGR
ncbi:MAG: hypothetical protein E6I91_03275 [Chloroflexi bacterium]|nr:MAG: hypothetical protein E6I91_03275 [Chloroflexota bacterium]